MKLLKTLPCALLLAAVATVTLADPGKNKGKDKGHGKGGDGSAAEHAPGHGGKHFQDDERSTIEAYFRKHPEARNELPPGLAKKGKVPPGWQKKLSRGDRIDDDVWALRVPLPHEVLIKLPPPPPGVVIFRIHDHIVRAHEKTREVLDVLGLPHP